MAKHLITEENRERIPGRGKSNKTRILEGIRAAAMLDSGDIHESDFKKRSDYLSALEDRFWKHIAIEAATNEKNGPMLLAKMMDKGWSNMKPIMESQSFDFDPAGTQAEQARQILEAASKGLLSPDVAKTYLEALASLAKVEEVTEIKAELEQVKAMIEELRSGD